MSEDREPSLLALYCSMEPVGGDGDGDGDDANDGGSGEGGVYDGGDGDDDDREPSLSEAPSEYCSM